MKTSKKFTKATSIFWFPVEIWAYQSARFVRSDSPPPFYYLELACVLVYSLVVPETALSVHPAELMSPVKCLQFGLNGYFRFADPYTENHRKDTQKKSQIICGIFTGNYISPLTNLITSQSVRQLFLLGIHGYQQFLTLAQISTYLVQNCPVLI